MNANINEKAQEQDELKKLDERLTTLERKIEYTYRAMKDIPDIVSEKRKADRLINQLLRDDRPIGLEFLEPVTFVLKPLFYFLGILLFMTLIRKF